VNERQAVETVIRVEGLGKRYRKVQAVEDLSFEVPPGSVFALMGNNGAGKSTTIRCLLGLEEFQQGSIDVLGLDPRTDGIDIRQQVGYVPEERQLYEWMTPAEIGRFVGAFYSNWSPGRFDSIVKHFDLPPDRRIAQLSRGMKAQVDLALALAHDPNLLVLDEPTGGLDPLVRRDFLESMITMAGQGKTVLVSSHEVGEVERVADRGLMLYNSKLVWVGELAPLKEGTCEVLLPDGVGPEKLGCDDDAVVYRDDYGGRCRMVVRLTPEAARQALTDQAGAEVKSMDLESIFVAYLRGAGARKQGSTLYRSALAEGML